MVNVKIQRASPTATFPTYGSEGAACMDLYADTKSMQESAMDGVVWVEPQVIHHGDRIAQLMFMEVDKINLIPTDTLEETKRGSGGFGSTGK